MVKRKEVLNSSVIIEGTIYEIGTPKKKIKKEHVKAIGDSLFSKEDK